MATDFESRFTQEDKFGSRFQPDEAAKPSYWEAAKYYGKEGLRGALRSWEIPGRFMFPEAGRKAAQEKLLPSTWLEPSEEEHARAEKFTIPQRIAGGLASLPGTALRYMPMMMAGGGIGGPLIAGAAGASEEYQEGKPLKDILTRGGEEAAIMGMFSGLARPAAGGLAPIEKLVGRQIGRLGRAGIGAGTFGIPALAEAGPREAIAPAVTGGLLFGLGPGKTRPEVAPAEPMGWERGLPWKRPPFRPETPNLPVPSRWGTNMPVDMVFNPETGRYEPGDYFSATEVSPRPPRSSALELPYTRGLPQRAAGTWKINPKTGEWYQDLGRGAEPITPEMQPDWMKEGRQWPPPKYPPTLYQPPAEGEGFGVIPPTPETPSPSPALKQGELWKSTRKEQQALKELGYSKRDILKMNSDQARDIISKRIPFAATEWPKDKLQRELTEAINRRYKEGDREISHGILDLYWEVEAGEAGKRIFRDLKRPGEGTNLDVMGIESTYPEFMQNKYARDETLRALEKGLRGEKLGVKEEKIYMDAWLESADKVNRSILVEDPGFSKEETFNDLTKNIDDEIMRLKEGEADGDKEERAAIQAIEGEAALEDPQIEKELSDFFKPEPPTEPIPITPDLSPTAKDQFALPGIKQGLEMRGAKEGAAPTLEGTPLMEAAAKAEKEKAQPSMFEQEKPLEGKPVSPPEPKLDLTARQVARAKEVFDLKGKQLTEKIADLARRADRTELTDAEEKLVAKLEQGKNPINFMDLGKKLNAEQAKFATGERPAAPLSPEDIQRVSDTHSAENSPDKVIVDKASDISEAILRQIPEDQRGNVKGVYDPATGKTYLVRENIGSEADLREVIDHEDIKHYAVDAFLGKEATPWFNRVFLKYGREGLKDIAAERGFDLNTQEGRIEAAREKIARTPIEETPGLIKQFYAWIREKLFKIFPKMKISDAEIQRTFQQATEAMKRGDFVARDEKINALRRQVRNIQAVYTQRAQFATGVGKKFAQEDLIPKAAQAKRGLKETFEWLSDVLVPTKGVPEKALETVRHYLGKLTEAKEAWTLKEIVADHTGAKVRDTFDRMTDKQNEDFINLAMVGEKQASPLLDQIREFMGNMDQALWEKAKYWKPDLGWVDNHLRLLLKPGASEEQVRLFRDTLSRRFPGTMGWSKQRFYETLQAAKEAGLELAVKNPWEMWKLGALDQMQFIEFNEMKAALQANGFLKKFKPEGVGRDFKGLEGYIKTTENLNRMWFQGKGEGWYVEENLGRILENYLSPDKIRSNALGRSLMSIKNHTTMAELALNAFHFTAESTNSLFSALGESARKIYNIGILEGNKKAIDEGLRDLLKAPGAPVRMARLGGSIRKYFANPEEFKKTFRGSEFLKQVPNPDEWLQLLYDSGARLGIAEDYKLNTLNTFKQNLNSKNYIGAFIRSVPALNQILMKPLFEDYIPNLKVGHWLKETMDMISARSEDILSGKITKEEIGANRWRSVEERFGEMSFDNLFWNRTFKTAMQMFVRSVTWQTGNIKAFGKGVSGQSAELISAMKEGRMPRLTPEGAWMMADFAGVALLGTIIQKMLTGKDPESWKDHFYPQIDQEGNRVSIPSYARVGFSMAHDPVKYVGGAMAGWFGRFVDVINNKDFYGAKIHDPEQNVIFQRVDDLVHLVPLPFSVTSMKKAREEGQPLAKQLTGFLGFTKAPYWIQKSPAQQLATELAGAKIPARGMTKAERGRTDLIKKYARDYQKAMREGGSPEEIFSNIREDLQSGKLTQRDLLRFRQRIIHEPLEQSILRLTLKEALRVWEKATDEEKARIAPYVLRKFRSTQSPEEREAALPKAQEIAQGIQ